MAAGEDLNAMFDRLEDDDSVNLTPVERLLLATDGTMTHMLEALTRGHVEVDIIDRRVHGSTLTRDVVLRRGRDGSPLVWAQSEVNLYPLDVEMEDRLVDGSVGIGDLLREEYAETRREVTGMSARWSGDDSLPGFIDAASTLYLEREYDIHSDEQRIMSILEWFPKGLF